MSEPVCPLPAPAHHADGTPMKATDKVPNNVLAFLADLEKWHKDTPLRDRPFALAGDMIPQLVWYGRRLVRMTTQQGE